MLGLIVSFCPMNIRSEVDRKATSLKWIWDRVRRHNDFAKRIIWQGNQSSIKRLSVYVRISGFLFVRVKMFDPTIAFDKDYMVFVAPKPGLFPK